MSLWIGALGLAGDSSVDLTWGHPCSFTLLVTHLGAGWSRGPQWRANEPLHALVFQWALGSCIVTLHSKKLREEAAKSLKA